MNQNLKQKKEKRKITKNGQSKIKNTLKNISKNTVKKIRKKLKKPNVITREIVKRVTPSIN
jgi:ribosomal protein S25